MVVVRGDSIVYCLKNNVYNLLVATLNTIVAKLYHILILIYCLSFQKYLKLNNYMFTVKFYRDQYFVEDIRDHIYILY